MATFSDALAWPFIYPWLQRPSGLIEAAFGELARRWKPILDHCDAEGIDYLTYIDNYRDTIKMFHVKDAEFNPTGRSGFYGGYQSWVDRPARTRNLGDGQVDFAGIFSKLAQYDYKGWAVLEWECVLKHPEDGAREFADFIRKQIFRGTDYAFDDFAGGKQDQNKLNAMLGLK